MKTLFILLILSQIKLFSYIENEDSIIVQTFVFDSITTRSADFLFPPYQNWEKVIMEYTLKCDPRTTRDQYNCGEWDYLTYTMVRDSSGRFDSTVFSQDKYVINSIKFDSIFYSDNSYNNFIRLNSISNNISQGQDTTVIKIDKTSSYKSINSGLYQFEYSNLPKSTIKSLKFFGQVGNQDLDYVEIRGKVGLAEKLLYSGPFLASQSEFIIYLNNPINIDGSYTLKLFIPQIKENLSVNILFSESDNQNQLSDNSNGKYLNFDGSTFIELDKDKINSISDQISIAFWANGNENLLPRNNSILEAVNNKNQRILNIHFPWSDSKIYWDAGNDGNNFDRINKEVSPENYLYGWNHWVFTKNTTTGSMKIYLNGNIFIESSNNLRNFEKIEKITLGSNTASNNFWSGGLKDFVILNKEITISEINQMMAGNFDYTNSFVLCNYKFDNDFFYDSKNQTNSDGLGKADIKIANFKDYINLKKSNLYPKIEFLNGNSVIIKDTSEILIPITQYPTNFLEYAHNSPNKIIGLNEIESTTKTLKTPTDTLSYYINNGFSYIYDLDNKVIDSIALPNQNKLVNEKILWYSPIVDYEIDRFITPYGIGLDLGADGFTWKIDVTDFSLLLHDNVRLSAGNDQELLDLKFIFKKGTPARNIEHISYLWKHGTYQYPDIVSNKVLAPIKMALKSNTESYRVKSRSSGHRFGVDGTDNCAEFCKRKHSLFVNKIQEFEWEAWKECGDNPVYPQGGTWLLDRTDWCPGAPVTTYNHELLDYMITNPIELDYQIEEKKEFVSYGDWVFSSYLIQYGKNNFNKDLEIKDIISPSLADEYSRYNPICSEAKFLIKNNGNKISSAEFEWRIGEFNGTFKRNIDLEFLEESLISFDLPFEIFEDWDGMVKTIEISIIKVDDSEDEYSKNNKALSKFVYPNNYFKEFLMELKSNNYGIFNLTYAPITWSLTNLSNKNKIFEGANLNNNSTKTEEVLLESDCYKIELINKEGLGLSYWAYDQYGFGKGSLILKSGTKILQNFKTEFGNFIEHQFRVGKHIKAKLSSESVDFGVVTPQSNTIRELAITPDNQKGLTIYKTSIFSSNFSGFKIDQTIPEFKDSLELNFGEELKLILSFNGKGSNKRTDVLKIESNDEQNKNIEIELVAFVNDPNSVEENSNLEFHLNHLSQNIIQVLLSKNNSISSNAKIELFNNLGQKELVLFDGNINYLQNEILINTENLSAGIHYIRLISENKVLTKLMIVE